MKVNFTTCAQINGYGWRFNGPTQFAPTKPHTQKLPAQRSLCREFSFCLLLYANVHLREGNFYSRYVKRLLCLFKKIEMKCPIVTALTPSSCNKIK